MAGDVVYYDDNATRLLNLMRDTFGDQFRGYFDGDAEPSEEWLPCIMVSKVRTSADISATGTDDLTEEIQIILCRNIKDDIGADPSRNLTEYTLRKQVEGQDPTTKYYMPGTVLYALRTNITLSDSTIQNITSIDYTQNYRGNIAVREAYITVTTVRKVIVLPRS